MKRDMMKTVNKKKSCAFMNPHYSMRCSEMEELVNLAESVGIYDALATAFKYGYILGSRAKEKELNYGLVTNK